VRKRSCSLTVRIHLYINHLWSAGTPLHVAYMYPNRRGTHSRTSGPLFSQTPGGRSTGRSVGRSVARSLALGKHRTDTRAQRRWDARGEGGGRTRRRRRSSRGAKAAEKGERLFCPAAKTHKSSSATRRTEKKEKEDEKGRRAKTAVAGAPGRWKRERRSEAFCVRAASRRAAPRRAASLSCRATPSRVESSHAAVRSTAVARPRRAQAELPRPRVAAYACSHAARRHAPGRVVDGGGARPARWRSEFTTAAAARHYAPRRETRLISAALSPSSPSRFPRFAHCAR